MTEKNFFYKYLMNRLARFYCHTSSLQKAMFAEIYIDYFSTDTTNNKTINLFVESRHFHVIWYIFDKCLLFIKKLLINLPIDFELKDAMFDVGNIYKCVFIDENFNRLQTPSPILSVHVLLYKLVLFLLLWVT